MDEAIEGPPAAPLLEGRSLTKRFPGVVAVDNVDFGVQRGLAHVLLGENGAGKSTLIKIFSGIYQPDAGELLIQGRPVSPWRPTVALEHGVATLYQEFTLVPHMTVMENIFLGREPGKLIHWIRDRGELRRRTEDLIEQFGFDLSPARQVASLRAPQRQMVEILRALSVPGEKVLMLDEPSSVLSGRETANLFAAIRKLKSRGVGLVYVTHRLEEIQEVGDLVTVMRDGKVVATIPSDQADRGLIVEWMVGRKLKAFTRERAAAAGEVALGVRDASRPPSFRGVSFELQKGEIASLFGLVGAGRTELVRAVVGADRLEQGSVEVRGRAVYIPSPARAVKLGLGLAPEDRGREGIVPDRSLEENVALAALDKCSHWGVLQRDKITRIASTYRDRLRIKAPSLKTKVRVLSGGNQQKIILARLLAAEAEILILDEPTRGIDVGSRREVYELLEALANSGKAVLVVTSDLDEALRISDRILVMAAGRMVGGFSRAEASRGRVLRLALPDYALARGVGGGGGDDEGNLRDDGKASQSRG